MTLTLSSSRISLVILRALLSCALGGCSTAGSPPSGDEQGMVNGQPNGPTGPSTTGGQNSQGDNTLMEDSPAGDEPNGEGGSGGMPGNAPTGSGGQASSSGIPICTGSTLENCGNWLRTTVLAKASFDTDSLDAWTAELQAPDDSNVHVVDGRLDIDVARGATIWFNMPFSGDISIEYTATMLDEGGDNDRVSDLNQFWKAAAPASDNPFGRSGTFADYDELLLYYVGMGGNDNTTTRFRKYPRFGTDDDIMLEDLDETHRLEGNKTYQVQILCIGAVTQFIVDGVSYFHYEDSSPLATGHFALRTVRSHVAIDDFWVHRLEKADDQ